MILPFSFSKIISHVFPGFLLIISVFMLIDSFCIEPGMYSDTICEDYKLENIIFIIGLILLLGTIIGIIIDGLQHILITEIFNKLNKNSELGKQAKKIYGIISSIYLDEIFKKKCPKYAETEILKEKLNEKLLNWYFYFPLIDIDRFEIYVNEFYYYYEFFANIFLVLLVTIFSVFFYTTKVLNLSYSWFITLIVICLTFFCIYAAWRLHKLCFQIRVNYVLGSFIMKHKNFNPYQNKVNP